MTTRIVGLVGEVDDYFHGRIPNDFLDLLAPETLGRGLGREVRILATDEDWVLKIQVRTGGFQNVHEWQVWQEVEHWNWGAKWLAPCKMISPSGLVLVQRRTLPLPPGYKMPKRVPYWLTDMKKSNWGLLNGKLVCHDYGMTRTMSEGLERKLRTVNHWNE